jgi:hypothetical protein
MDWNSIIIALISALTGGGLTALLTLQQARKKAEGEADSAAVQPLKEANEIIREQLKESNEREQELEDRVRSVTAEKDALYEQNAMLREENAVIKQYICVHGGCQLRKPGKGLGPKFFADHRGDFELTVDNLPVNVLLKDYGRRKDALAEMATSDAGTPGGGADE